MRGAAIPTAAWVDRARFGVGVVACAAAFGAIACEAVTSVPATLAGGVYCLDADVATGGQPAFTLESNATLDCRGHTISDATLATINAVVGSGDNVEIRNCVVHGFLTPFSFKGVTNFRIVGNTLLSPMNTAISINGDDGLVADNTIRYPAARYEGYPGDWYGRQTAILALGTVDIIRNTISSAITGDGSGWDGRYGIYAGANEGGVIAFNIIRGLVAGRDAVGAQTQNRWGLMAGGPVVVYRNVIVSTTTSGSGSSDVGLFCGASGEGESPPLAAQNISRGFAVPYYRCENAGETDARSPRRPMPRP
ncbi:MAG: hypothetical protein ACTHOC_05160 [Luteimonas sp.]